MLSFPLASLLFSHQKQIPTVNLALLILTLFIATSAAQSPPPSGQPRERLNFDAGWLFQRNDPDDLHDQSLDYSQLKAYLLADANDLSKSTPISRPAGNPGANISYVKPDFDDKGWRQVNLPHDWAIEGPFNIAAPGDTGKLPWEGQGWYRKHFTIPASDAGRHLFLDIDGAMSYSTIWINGQFVGGWPYGYSSFEIELTPHIKFGEDNVVSIRLSNPPQSSRWYPGAGIYRNVWLTKTSAVHVSHWGTRIITEKATADSANLNYRTTLINQGQTDASTQTTVKIYALDSHEAKTGDPVAVVAAMATQVGAGMEETFETQIPVPHPALWNLAHPNLYVAVTEVQQEGKLVDQSETVFGIRTIKFDPDKGFFLNGERVQLNGVCGHADLGALGMAFNDRAAERQLEILKEMGCNAFRTSHNMPAPELLDLCDRMGILVMDESLDCWRGGKKPNDYHLLYPDWCERDFRAEFRRDRNHPSIIMWSLGNEMPDLWYDDRKKEAAKLTSYAHDEDPSRPTTVGSNKQDTWEDDKNGAPNGIQHGLDMYGQNYPTCYQKQPWDLYERYHLANPTSPIFGSETASCVSSRGFYLFPVDMGQGGGAAQNQMSSYDLYAPGWACPPDTEFAALDHCPFVAGEFVWTGFDYLGEPTPYSADLTNVLNYHDPEKVAKYLEELKEKGKTIMPSRSSYFGIVDLCGFKKDRFYLYQAHWRHDLPMAHILPHWNWPDRVGKVTPVYVYTSGDEAELFLNGKSQGKRSRAANQPLPINLALNHTATASTEETYNQNLAANAVDGTKTTRWCASDGRKDQWWQVDLGQDQPIRSILINFEMTEDKYQYILSTSSNGTDWQNIVTKNTWDGSSSAVVHHTNTTARYVRITFTDLGPRNYASISEVGVYSDDISVDSFFQDHYRMRWSNVLYEPGELKVVSYKNGQRWAEATVKTTGEPSALQLEADHSTIRGDGLDLSYLTTRIVDSAGLTVPTAQNRIKYEVVSGPGTIVATDNGDPTDLETFSNPERHAFNGLALLILKGQPGQTGDVKIRASSDGLAPAEFTVHVD